MTDKTDTPSQQRIRVRFLTKERRTAPYKRQLPEDLCWGNCQFIFADDDNDYDWLVVYDDIPTHTQSDNKSGQQEIHCPEQNTILVTMEPSNIKTYGRVFVSQFGHILTSQEPGALRHNSRIYSQPALRWYYGLGKHHQLSLQHLRDTPTPVKDKTIATVCSTKQQKHTLHHRRYTFVQELKALLPEMDVFGHGVIEIDDKAESLDPYQYHIAIENHFAPHHWTEKLSDAFLGHTLPFYYGCPNLAEYFPQDSYISIDINDVEGAYRIISEAIKNNEYEKRKDAIAEARRLVLEKYNLFAVLADNISRLHDDSVSSGQNHVLLSRRAARIRYPVKGFLDLLEKARNQIINRFS